MSQVIIYTTDYCPYCKLAKELLTRKQISYQEIRIDLDTSERDNMIRLSGRRTVPQIFINGHAIGGYDDLAALVKADKLNNYL